MNNDHPFKDHPLWPGLNRLIFIASALLGLKLFAYVIQDFLPILGQVLARLFSAFLPLVVAFIFAFLLEPIVRRLIKYLRFKRVYAAILTLVLMIGVIGLILFLISVRLYNELSELSITLPDYHVVVGFIEQQIDTVEKFININVSTQIQDTLLSSSRTILGTMSNWITAASTALLNIISGLPGFFAVVVISIVATLLVSIYFPAVKRFVVGMVPLRWEQHFRTVTDDLGTAVFGFLRAEFILVSITGTILTVGLLVIGNPYAVTIGVLSALLDVLPVVGTGIIFFPWIVILFLTGATMAGIKLTIVYALSVVVRQFLEPKVMSKGIGLNPLATLISMYAGMNLFGGFGLIIGPAIVIIYEALRKAGIIKIPRD